jgi:TonB family protein
MFIRLAPVVIESAPGAGSAFNLNETLLTVWAAGTVLLGLFMVVSWFSLNGQRREWRPDSVDGVPVMVARKTGPAVLGVRYPDIVVPEWALQMDLRVRRLMLLHEGEHVRAGDTRLVAAGLIVLAAAPWNLPLWWQFRRLRQAVELDCDGRVLRRVPDRRRYGSLLIEVGQRRSMPMLGVALAEPASFLERRIRQITLRSRVSGIRRVLLLTAATFLLSGAAVFTRDPMVLADPDRVSKPTRVEPHVLEIVLPEPERSTEPTRLVAGPVHTPMTEPPKLLNSEEFIRSLERNYPVFLRDAGIGGEVSVWFYVDTDGRVQRTLVDKSSGYPALDEAALRVSSSMRFSPAMNRDQVVDVWVSIPIHFEPMPARTEPSQAAAAGNVDRTARVRGPDRDPAIGSEQSSAARAEAPTPVLSGVSDLGNSILAQQRLAEARRLEQQTAMSMRSLDQRREQVRKSAGRALNLNEPTFTPMTAPPAITNEREVSAALRREFQRTGEASGEVTLWFYIDETGRVLKTILDRSSGSQAVDEAALRVTSVMRFSPARNGRLEVPVWISLPVKFSRRE